MTVKFCFGNKRNDGRQNLKIRLKHRGKDAKIAIPVYMLSPSIGINLTIE